MRDIITRDLVRRTIATVLRRYSPKMVAGAIKGSERNVYNWRTELSEPSAYQLIRLMSEYDEICDAVLFMAGRKEATNTLSQQDIALIHQAISLIGVAIPASTISVTKDSLCHHSSYQFTKSGADFVGQRMANLVTV